jgi:hypothetical protein
MDMAGKVDPIRKLFGSGLICLHVDDPLFQSTPAFQELARQLEKKYNRVSPK